MPEPSYAVNTLYIDPEIDDWLMHQALSSKKSKNDVMRKYLELGIAHEAAAKTQKRVPDQVIRRIRDQVAKSVLVGASGHLSSGAGLGKGHGGGAAVHLGTSSIKKPAKKNGVVAKVAKRVKKVAKKTAK